MAPDEKRHGNNKSWGPMVCVPPEANKSPFKFGAWETILSEIGARHIFRSELLVSGKAGCCFYTTGKVEGATPEIPNGSLGGGHDK